MARGDADWEAVEREYRAGQLSIREIARNAGVSDTAIRKRASAYGWSRDLSELVREAVRDKLVRENVCIDHANDEEIIETAASRGVEVVRQHRSTLGRLNRIANSLLDAIEARISAANGQLDPSSPAVAASFTVLGDKETLADAMEKVQRAVTKVIPLERQAFSLDEKQSAPASVQVVITPEESGV